MSCGACVCYLYLLHIVHIVLTVLVENLTAWAMIDMMK